MRALRRRRHICPGDRRLFRDADGEEAVRARAALADTALASPEETAWVFKQLLETLAEDRPVVAVVDDLHFAETRLIDVLDYVATLSVDRPILLLACPGPISSISGPSGQPLARTP